MVHQIYLRVIASLPAIRQSTWRLPPSSCRDSPKGILLMRSS